MPITSFPREPGVAGGKADFSFFFTGPVEIGQDGLMPVDVRRDTLRVDQIEAYVHPDEPAPTGRDMILAVYLNGVEIGQVTIADGAHDAVPVGLDPQVVVEAYDKVTAKILQTGNGVRGGTTTLKLRVA